jgi:hypothetical protein
MKRSAAARQTAEERAFLPAMHEVIETPASPTLRYTALALCGFVAIGLAWACLSRVDRRPNRPCTRSKPRFAHWKASPPRQDIPRRTGLGAPWAPEGTDIQRGCDTRTWPSGVCGAAMDIIHQALRAAVPGALRSAKAQANAPYRCPHRAENLRPGGAGEIALARRNRARPRPGMNGPGTSITRSSRAYFALSTASQ